MLFVIFNLSLINTLMLISTLFPVSFTVKFFEMSKLEMIGLWCVTDKAIDLPQVTDKLYQEMLYRAHLAM